MSSEDFKNYAPTDPELIDKIVNNIKSKGIFDQFRKDCLADVDTKPAYQNLQQRVTGMVSGFLTTQKWQQSLNKTQLRENLRRHTVQQAFLEVGVDRIVDQVVNPKIFSVFMPKVEDVVCELLGIEKPKPKRIEKPKPKPLALNFQEFKKSLEALPTIAPVPDRAAPSPERIKEEPEEIEKTEENPVGDTQPFEEKPPEPPQASPTPEREERVEPRKDSDPISPGGSASEVLNNDDDSNTIDEMPLLAASLDSDSNRGGSPVMDGAPQNNSTKIGAISEMSNSYSFLSTRPPPEYDSSSNNLSSLKSEEKISPSKKFDNFSNLGEKLKQADVNLRETSVTKKEDIMDESSDVTKSSENDTESPEMKIDLPSESNMSSVDAFRHEPTKVDMTNERLFSEDSRSSVHSLKNKSKQTETRDDRSRLSKHEKKSSGSKSKDSKSTKADKKDECLDDVKETVKKDHKTSNSSKQHDSKSRSKEDNKDKSKSSNDKDKHKSSKDKSHSADKHGKSNSTKDRRDKKDENEKKNEDTKVADSNNRHSEKKKREDERSRHHSKDTKDLKSHKKVDDLNRNDSKEKNKSAEKEKKSDDPNKNDHEKSKKDSGGKSGRSKSNDGKHRDDRKKDDDKKDNDDDRKKSPRKRKSGRCDDDEIKSKNSRRSSDRDSNGNAGGGSAKSKSSNSSSHNGRKSSKTDKRRSHTKSKEQSNQSDGIGEDCEMKQGTDMDDADEVDMILMEINNSIQNENQRLNISEVLNEPTVKKPKIARNFHEIKKIMQARKNIDQRISNDMKYFPTSRCEENVSSEQESHEIDGGIHEISPCNKESDEVLQNNLSIQDVSTIKDGNEVVTDELPSDTSSEIELKNCSIVITDVLRGQLKNSTISSLANKRIILEDGAVKKISSYSPNSSDSVLDASIVDLENSPNPNASKPEQSGSSVDLISFISSAEMNPSTAHSNVLPENNIHSAVSEEDKSSSSDLTVCRETAKSTNEENVAKCSETAQMAETKTEDHVKVPGPEACTVPVLPEDGLDIERESREFEASENAEISRVRVKPGCSSDNVQSDDEFDSENAMQRESKKVRGKTSAVRRSKDKDQSNNSILPSRLRRVNAGIKMHTILEGINEKIAPSKHYMAVNRSTKRKGAKLDTSKNVESVTETEVCTPVVNNRISQASDSGPLTAEVAGKPCSTDDGSDVSNKENDETNGTCKSRNQMVDVGPNEAKETRSTRRRNPTNDLSEDLSKSTDNNNITKGRVSLKCKNNRDELGCVSEEVLGKVEDDLETKKFSTVSNRLGTRKGVTPLNMRNTELEKGLGVNSSAESCAANSLLEKTRFSEETCKSTESLHMDKENITVPPTCDNATSGEQGLISVSHRRKSCPDVFENPEVDNKKDSSNERVPSPVHQDKSSISMLEGKTPEDTSLGNSPLLKGAGGKTANHGRANRRSGRRFGNAGNNESLPTKDNENGNRVSRNDRRKVSSASNPVPRKTDDEGLSLQKCASGEIKSVGVANPLQCSEDKEDKHFPTLPNIQHPSTITINIDSSVNVSNEDEPPQVTLYFDDSAVATFNSGTESSKSNSQAVPLSEDVELTVINSSKGIGVSKSSKWTKSGNGEGVSQLEQMIEREETSYSADKDQKCKGEHPLGVSLHQDLLLEDTSSSEFKGFSQDERVQDQLEKDLMGFTDDDIQEAGVQLSQFKQYFANQLQSPMKADNITNRLDGPPKAKKTRVASEGVASSIISEESSDSPATRRNIRKRNFSLNSSPDKDKKEVLGGQCKAESKDSGLCESPEQQSFTPDMCRNDADVKPGESTVRTRKMANVLPSCTTDLHRILRKDKSSDTPNKKQFSKTRNPQRYSSVDLYKPRPVVGRDTRTSNTLTPTTSRGRPKKST